MDFLGNQLSNVMKMRGLDLGQSFSPIADALKMRNQMQFKQDMVADERAYKEGLANEQARVKNAAAQAVAVLNQPEELQRQALTGFRAQANDAGDEQAVMVMDKLLGADNATMQAQLTQIALAGGAELPASAMKSLAGGSSELPSSVQETLWYNQQSPEVQQAHMELKRKAGTSLEDKLAYERKLAGIKAEQKGDEVRAVTDAKTKSSDAIAGAAANEAQGKALGSMRGDILADETNKFRALKSQTLQLKQLEKALEAADTGKYAQLKSFAGKYIPGVDIDNEQALESIVTQYALTELQKQSGTKTDLDFLKAAETQIQSGNTKGANKIILERMKENAKYGQARYDAFKKYKSKNKNLEDFEDSFSYESDYDKKNAVKDVSSLSDEDLFK